MFRPHSLIAGGIAILLWASATPAATNIESLQYSPDITTILVELTTNDQDAINDDRAGSLALMELGTLPASADLTSYAVLPNGDQVFTLDTSVVLNEVTFTPRDSIRFDGETFAMDLDGMAAGLPAGSAIDALAIMGEDAVLFSLDIDAVLGETFVADEDLAVAMTNDAGGIDVSLFFDGDGNGIDPALDLDGAHLLANNNLLLSFDGSGVVENPAPEGEEATTVNFDDEDVLEFNGMTFQFERVYDGSTEHSTWGAADMNALAATEIIEEDKDKEQNEEDQQNNDDNQNGGNNAGNAGGGGGGGDSGGCTIATTTTFDPLLPLMLITGLAGLLLRIKPDRHRVAP